MQPRHLQVCILVAACLAMLAPALAQEMPETGPPAELKKLDYMIGTWKGDFTYKADPMSEVWSTTEVTMKVEWVLGGCAQRTHFSGKMMGMDFEGYATTTYDRESKQWQGGWFDNMSAKQVMTTGEINAQGHLVLEGAETYGGQSFLTRDTTMPVSDTEFNWLYELSFDGGTTWVPQMKANYKKQ